MTLDRSFSHGDGKDPPRNRIFEKFDVKFPVSSSRCEQVGQAIKIGIVFGEFHATLGYGTVEEMTTADISVS